MIITKPDLSEIPERRLDENVLDEDVLPEVTAPRPTPPHRERRVPHVFKQAEGARHGSLGVPISCVTCGYGEEGHPALTDPEQEVVAALINQRQAPPFMRRSILRKITSRLGIG